MNTHFFKGIFLRKSKVKTYFAGFVVEHFGWHWTSQKPEASQEPEAKSQKQEASQKPEAKSQKPKAKSQKPKARSQKPEAKKKKNCPPFLNPTHWRPEIARDLAPVVAPCWRR